MAIIRGRAAATHHFHSTHSIPPLTSDCPRQVNGDDSEPRRHCSSRAPATHPLPFTVAASSTAAATAQHSTTSLLSPHILPSHPAISILRDSPAAASPAATSATSHITPTTHSTFNSSHPSARGRCVATIRVRADAAPATRAPPSFPRPSVADLAAEGTVSDLKGPERSVCVCIPSRADTRHKRPAASAHALCSFSVATLVPMADGRAQPQDDAVSRAISCRTAKRNHRPNPTDGLHGMPSTRGPHVWSLKAQALL